MGRFFAAGLFGFDFSAVAVEHGGFGCVDEVEGLSGGEVAIAVVELRRFIVFDGGALREEVGQMGNGLVEVGVGQGDHLQLGISIG